MSDTVRYYDPCRPPFSIHGFYQPSTGETADFKRLPDEVALATSEGVAALYRHSAGGRIRFATDAAYITVRASILPHATMPHCTPILESGFDLYLDTDRDSRYLGECKFDTALTNAYEVTLPLPAGHKELTLNMPLYGTVTALSIGLPADAAVTAHKPYRHELPVVFYGSSITQGACASRPGLCYQAYLTRRLDCDYINLGFSGSARGEDAIVNYMASLPMSAFVSDYDHNAPSPDHLRATHYKLYTTIREKHPGIPYIMATRPDFLWREDDIERRAIIMESYLTARRAGDQHVYFLDGSAFFIPTQIGESRGDFTADLCHPTDTGFRRMAAAFGDVLEAALGW